MGTTLALYLAKGCIFAVWSVILFVDEIDQAKEREARNIIGVSLVIFSALVTFAIP